MKCKSQQYSIPLTLAGERRIFFKGFTGLVFAALLITSCSNDSNKDQQNNESTNTTTQTSQDVDNTGQSITENKPTAAAVKNIVNSYLQLKNALAADNGQDAASAGKEMVDAIQKTDKSSFSVEQQAEFADLADDAKEHAEHIASNGNNIKHQREHFDMLSKDMYDLVKNFGSSQTLYQTYCPMYNDKKGATWLSEMKMVKNPYFGAEMPTCGEVKEEVK